MLVMFGYLWFIFGSGAIIAAILNVACTIKGKDAKWFRFTSISLTALTLCAFYSQSAIWVLHKDWSALEDVVPAVSMWLLILTLISIVLNSISLFYSKRK